MSFAQNVKKEIANLKVEEDILKAELYGFLKLKAEIVIRNKQIVCELKTNLLPIVRRVTSIVKQLYKVNIEVLEKERLNLDKKNIYLMTMSDKCKEATKYVASLSAVESAKASGNISNAAATFLASSVEE